MRSVDWIRACTALTAFLAIAGADAGVVPTKGAVISLRSGSYDVQVNPGAAWTLHAIHYDGVRVGLSNGYYGAVLWVGPAQFIGTGHTEGGVEQVMSISLTVDGQTHAVEPGRVYSGDKLVFTKRSMIDQLESEAVLSLDANGLGESLRVSAKAAQSVEGMYVFMHPFTTATREWIAGMGQQEYSGELLSDNDWELRKQVEWVALYAPTNSLGVLVAYPEAYAVAGIKNGIWDLERYHKLYLQAIGKRTFAVGETQVWSMSLRCFRAQQDEWRAKVRDLTRVEKAD